MCVCVRAVGLVATSRGRTHATAGACASPECPQQQHTIRAEFACCLLQIFPLIPAPGGENVGFSECARNYLALKPRKGDGTPKLQG